MTTFDKLLLGVCAVCAVVLIAAAWLGCR